MQRRISSFLEGPGNTEASPLGGTATSVEAEEE